MVLDIKALGYTLVSHGILRITKNVFVGNCFPKVFGNISKTNNIILRLIYSMWLDLRRTLGQ